ncbi:MAG: YggT family protein [Ktedonobacterales bacterium]|nr:YggT family protein [Ktedonobacterales bacterium]
MQPTQTNQPYQNEQPQQYMAPNPMAPMQPAAPAPARVESTSVSSADRVAMAVYVLFGILEGLIAIRILLKLLGANPDAGFSAFIYNLTAPFVGVFNGVFGTPSTHSSIFEFSSVLALAVYALIGWGVVRLISVFGQRQTTTLSR